MAELGYNSVRLPIAANFLLAEEPGYCWLHDNLNYLDQILDWCEKYQLYAILDLHAAPGGQSGACCDDGIDNFPHMFLEPESKERTIRIWEQLAQRYKDRWIIGGYNLLNEPLVLEQWKQYDSLLSDFYDECIARIRAIDQNHMFTIEGPGFSSDTGFFDHDFDPYFHNWCIHVHSYNFDPQVRTLYPWICAARANNVPIWIGEGNSTSRDMAVFYEMAAYYDIGFCLWSWKSAYRDENAVDALTYSLPDKWDKMLAFLTKGGARPSYSESQELFNSYLENIKYENCNANLKVHQYCMRKPGIHLPAGGYDIYETGEITSGEKWIFGNPYSYRTEDKTKLVMRPCARLPRPNLLGVTARDPLSDLWLELSDENFACYTVRDADHSCYVLLEFLAITDVSFSVHSNQEVYYGDEMKNDSLMIRETLLLLPKQKHQVIVKVLKGTMQIASIRFKGNDNSQ